MDPVKSMNYQGNITYQIWKYKMQHNKMNIHQQNNVHNERDNEVTRLRVVDTCTPRTKALISCEVANYPQSLSFPEMSSTCIKPNKDDVSNKESMSQ